MSGSRSGDSRTGLLVTLLVALLAILLFVGVSGLEWTAMVTQNAILFLTGAVVLFYTYETHEMREQMVRQNELAVQPLVLASVRFCEINIGRYGWHIVLRNVGKGPAVFVQAEDFSVTPLGVGRIALNFAPVDCLIPEEEAPARVRMVIEEGGSIQFRESDDIWNYTALLTPEQAKERHEITIRYEDIDGRKYWTKMQMGKGGNRLLDHGRD